MKTLIKFFFAVKQNANSPTKNDTFKTFYSLYTRVLLYTCMVVWSVYLYSWYSTY